MIAEIKYSIEWLVEKTENKLDWRVKSQSLENRREKSDISKTTE